MKLLTRARATAAAVMLATALVGMSATAANATDAPVATGGGSAIAADNTSVTVGGPTKNPTTNAVVNVGGGTWSYGSTLAIWPPKTCYSNYVHNTKYHSSTAIIGNSNTKVYANAGYFSNASTWAGASYTCYAYWNTY